MVCFIFQTRCQCVYQVSYHHDLHCFLFHSFNLLIFPVSQDQDNEQLEANSSVYPVSRFSKWLFGLHLADSSCSTVNLGGRGGGFHSYFKFSQRFMIDLINLILAICIFRFLCDNRDSPVLICVEIIFQGGGFAR